MRNNYAVGMSIFAALYAPVVIRPPTGLVMRIAADEDEYDYSGKIDRIRIVKNCLLSKRQKRRLRGKKREEL
jgi:hypothetical protein